MNRPTSHSDNANQGSPPETRRAARDGASCWVRAAAAWAICMCCAACNSFGPRQIPIDRFDYNSAIATSANDQMLLNLVRLRFGEVPTFLAVNSVLTQYIWNGEAGIAAAGGESLNFPAWTVGGSVNARYIERPTVTYSPLSGQEFAAQLLNPVRADVVFSLVSSGWPPDELLTMTIQRINEVHNVRFADARDPLHEQPRDFDRIVKLIIELARRDAIELVRSTAPDKEESYLEFPETPDERSAALVRELKDTLGLDQGRSRFRVTRKIVGRGPDEVTIRMHSLLELMGLLSAGVPDPADPAGTPGAPSPSETAALPGPLRIRCGRDRPGDALVAVQYHGDWYSISRSDDASKRAFGLLTYLFQMQASQNQGAGPLLTVPVG